MKARAEIVAEADGHGGTRLPVLHGEPPLLLRRTGPAASGRHNGTVAGAVVHLVGGAAGPLRGDDLGLDIHVGPGARLEIRSVAASLALPGRPAPPSRLVIHADIAGSLLWAPEPLIAAAGCDHLTTTTADVAEGGRLVWRDDLVCGRHREESGDVRTETTFRYAGTTLYRHDLDVGPHAPGWLGAAVLGGGRAYGSVLLIGGDDLPDPGLLPGDAARMPLAGRGLVATAVGPDIRAVRAALDPFTREAHGTGHVRLHGAGPDVAARR